MNRHVITVIGGAHIDRRGRIDSETRPGSSNPGTWFEEAGGGGFNAARDLALLGHDVTMVTVSGGDAAGEMVARAAEQSGVTLLASTFLDRRTPSYTAILENDGNLVIALADMALYDLMTPRRLKMRALRDRLAASDLIVCDANLPAETIQSLAATLDETATPLAAIGISPAKVVRLQGSLGNLAFLFMNEAEACAICPDLPQMEEDWPAAVRRTGLKGGFITRGRKAAIGWSIDTAAMLIPPSVDVIGDVTGAGDAFAAGALHAFLAGGDIAAMQRHGTALARLAVLSPLAVPQVVGESLLAETLALVPEPRLLA